MITRCTIAGDMPSACNTRTPAPMPNTAATFTARST